MTTAVQRAIGMVVLLAAGVVSLPGAAYFLDGRATENWIVPAQLVAMAIVGAAVTLALPALARAGEPPARRAVTGVWWGLLASLVGVAIFWFLLNGLGGA